MISIEIVPWYKDGVKCTFYSVKIDDSEVCETDKFFEKFEESEHSDDANDIAELLFTTIGDKYGAIDDFFDRFENSVIALPPKFKSGIEEIENIGKHFPLRLYCYRISESIVILMNGGKKDEFTAQDSPGVSMHFRIANNIADRIVNALHDEMVVISGNGRELLSFDGLKEILL